MKRLLSMVLVTCVSGSLFSSDNYLPTTRGARWMSPQDLQKQAEQFQQRQAGQWRNQEDMMRQRMEQQRQNQMDLNKNVAEEQQMYKSSPNTRVRNSFGPRPFGQTDNNR